MTENSKFGPFSIDASKIQTLSVQMSSITNEPWAVVDRDGTVSKLDIDAARAATKDTVAVGLMERAIACRMIAAYEKGLAEGAAK